MKIATTHAGSLPRPTALNALFGARGRGELIDRGELDALVADATRQSVAKQVEVGLDMVNNGEQGRESFFTYVRERMSGFGTEMGEARPFRDRLAFPTYVAQRKPPLAPTDQFSLARLPACVGEIRALGTGPVMAEIAELQRCAAEAHHRGGLFLTVPSPGIVATAMTNRHYASINEYVSALGEALAPEYRSIVGAGLKLQIDAPDLAMERHVLYGDRPLQDFTEFAEHVVATINSAIAGLPREQIRLHVCWGNYNAPHCFDVAFADILSTIASANVGSLVMSMANPRHEHEVRLLTRPELAGFQFVVGVIDTTTNYVEHPELVADRLVRAAHVVGDPSRISAGPDCGFATSAGFTEVASEVAWLKLAAMVEGAAIASERLS